MTDPHVRYEQIVSDGRDLSKTAPRTPSLRSTRLGLGPYGVFVLSRVTRGDRQVDLTANQFQLLEYLTLDARRPRR